MLKNDNTQNKKQTNLKEVITDVLNSIFELLVALIFNPLFTFWIIIIICFLYLGIKRVCLGFTPANEIAIELRNDSQYKRDCIMCMDSWISHSRGRGTCSHHGGIKRYIKKGQYSRTMSDCMKEAKAISWID